MTTLQERASIEDFFSFLNEKYVAPEDPTENVAEDPFDPANHYTNAAQVSMNIIIHIFDYIRYQCQGMEYDFTDEDVFRRFANFINRERFAIQVKLDEVPADSIIKNVIEGEISPYDMVLKELWGMGITADAGSLHR